MKKQSIFFLLLTCFILTLQVRAQSVLYVTSLGDNGPGTLRQQITNAFPGDTIRFQITGTIFLSTGWLDFAKELVIEGPGMDDLILTPTTQDRIMRIQDSDITISDLTFKDGYSTSASWSGGLTAYGGNVAKIKRVKFEGNYKGGLGSSPAGGAFSCLMEDSIVVDSCIFIDNQTYKSNGDAGGGAASLNANQSVIVKNSQFDSNNCSGGCNPSNGDYSAKTRGGALLISGSASSTVHIFIDSCLFNNNRSYASCTYSAGGASGKGYAYGSAVHFSSVRHAESIKVKNSTFTLNNALGSGSSSYDYSYGAISNDESASITTSTIELENIIFDGNIANGTTFAGPSAVSIEGGGLKMNNCKVINNTSESSAVKVLAGQPVDIAYCDFSDNDGTAINSNVYSGFTQNIRNCLFKGNSNSAIRVPNVSGTTNIINSTFTANSSDGGSSMYLSGSGLINILNCTMMNEQVLVSGEPHSIYLNNASNVYMKNNIISIPVFSSDPLFLQTGSTVVSGGGNIVRDASASTFLVDPTDMNTTDPQLGTFADHGGPTFTYDLQATSPAIDLGGSDTINIDQRGYIRDANIDAGAFEFGASDPNTPIVLSQSNDTTICSNSSVEIWVESNHPPQDPVQYQWKLNGTNITGANDSSYVHTIPTTGIYNYTCEVSNNSGAIESSVITVEVLVTPNIQTSSDVSICQGVSTTISASGGLTYSWDNSLGAGASHTVTPTTTTTYNVTGTDGNGCENTDNLTVTVSSLPTVTASGTASICEGNSTTLTASGATNYTWDNGAGTGSSVSVSPTSNTTYTVTGTDGNGCENTDDVTVSVNSLPAVIASGTAAICEGESTTLTASGAANYTWNNGVGTGSSVSVSPTTNTTYTVTGTDANGCENTDDVSITVNPLPSVVASGTATICEGESTNLTASGATNYTWDNGAGTGTSVSVTPTTNTTYTVTGTDANGCENTDDVTITLNSSPTVTASADVAICEGESTSISASGANNYSWNNGAGTGSSVSVAPTTNTTYTVTGTDGNGCENADDVTVTVNPLPTVTASADEAICEGESTSISASGATNYTWNNGAGTGTSVSVAPTTNTTYTVTGTDANGCENTDDVTISVNPLPTVTASGTATICEGESTSISASGANNYSWDNGAGTGSSVSVAPTSNTTYTVTGTDGNGCENTDDVTITVNPLPTVTASADEAICEGESTTISASGAIAFTWDNGLGSGSTQTVSPTSNTTYIVTGTDANGCENTDQVTISTQIVPDNGVTLEADNVTITANSSGIDYTWIDCDNNFQAIPGETSQSFTATENGNYAVIVTNQGCADTSDCVVIDKVSLTSNSLNPNISLVPNPTSSITKIVTDSQINKVQVVDFSGKIINVPHNKSGNELNFSNLPVGTYFIQIQTLNGNYVERVVVM